MSGFGFDQQIGRAQEAASGLPGYARLKQEGEEIRQRIHSVGFAPSDRLFVVGRKPV